MRIGASAFLASVLAIPALCRCDDENGRFAGAQACARGQHGSVSTVVSRGKRGKVIELKIQDNGRRLTLPVEQTIRITLAENPTTGYRWQFLENGAPVLRLTRDSFQRGSSSAVGAGGNRILEFVADAAGTASLRLGYARASDPASQKNEFALTVQVSAP